VAYRNVFSPNIYVKLERQTTKYLSCFSYGKTSKPGLSQLREHNPNEWKETFSNQFVISVNHKVVI